MRRTALPLLLCIASFGASPAQAYKAGSGADDRPDDIPEYADAAAYLADPSRTDHRNVKIGEHTLPIFHIEEFNDNVGLTNANLIASYSNVAAYLADNGRANRLYAEINGNVYLVTLLEARNNAGTLGDASLPDPVAPGFSTTAVGDSARAKGYDATAVGNSAFAGDQATAVGQVSRASGTRSVAVGDHARATGGRSVAVGKSSRAASDRATAVGQSANSYGGGATSLGASAAALGERTMALGRNAVAAKPGADGELVPESFGLGGLIGCAHDADPWLDTAQGFTSDCYDFLTDDEKADARLGQDNAAGRTFRQTVRTRLQARLATLTVNRATAVGANALAGADRTTAVGQYAHATGTRSTALGSAAVASGDNGVAVGRAAFVTGEDGTAVGHYAQIHGDRGVALGKYAGAGGWVTWKRYADAAAYLADDDRTDGGVRYVVIAGKVYFIEDLEAVSGLTDSKLPVPLGDVSQVVSPTEIYRSVSDYLADTGRTGHRQVIIAGKVYDVAELEAVSGLTAATLPEALEGAPGTVAVGAHAQAPREYAVAVGEGAVAIGEESIAIGAGAIVAGDHSIAVGGEAVALGDGSMAIGDRARSNAGVEEYADVAAFLADPNRNDHRYVKVGRWVYPRWQLAEFHSGGGLTDSNLVKTYADVAAWRADAQRTGAFYAAIGGRLYLSSLLEAYQRAGVLADDNLPFALLQSPETRTIALGPRANADGYRATAVGGGAAAPADEATAVGEGARAGGRKSTAVGRGAWALERSATALGGRAFAYSGDSTALGAESKAYGHGALAAGASAAGYGEDATALGTRAVALGERTTALGRGAVAAKLGAGQTVFDAVPEWSGLSGLIECARNDWYAPDAPSSGENLLGDCSQYLTDAEKRNADLLGDDAAGRALRQAIRQRLEGRLAALAAPRATAVGAQAQALNEYATALGQFARAIEAHSTALGARAVAIGQGSIAIGSRASATGANGIAIGAGVSAGANEVVIGSAGHTYKLPGLAHSASDPVGLTIDAEGRLVVTLPPGTSSRSQSQLLSAAPGAAPPAEPPKGSDGGPDGAGNGGGGPDGSRLRSDGGTGEPGGGAPGQPAVPVRTALLPAPDGPDPATTERLDRLETGFNRSLGVLGDRLDRATAMSSALTALPNVVPNGGRFYVGAGAGSYRGRQAVAVGISARGGSRGNVFFNAGAATAGSGSMSMRAGVGFVW